MVRRMDPIDVAMQANLAPEMRTGAFGPEQPAPPGPGPYDRIAAFAGRRVAQ